MLTFNAYITVKFILISSRRMWFLFYWNAIGKDTVQEYMEVDSVLFFYSSSDKIVMLKDYVNKEGPMFANIF